VTETEWHSCTDPMPMLEFLRGSAFTGRGRPVYTAQAPFTQERSPTDSLATGSQPCRARGQELRHSVLGVGGPAFRQKRVGRELAGIPTPRLSHRRAVANCPLPEGLARPTMIKPLAMAVLKGRWGYARINPDARMYDHLQGFSSRRRGDHLAR
jgi:hypothetical protein